MENIKKLRISGVFSINYILQILSYIKLNLFKYIILLLTIYKKNIFDYDLFKHCSISIFCLFSF